MNKFEKRFGKYAIKNLSIMLIMCYAVGYVIQIISPEFIGMLSLNPYLILKGQVWRLFTWIVVPPSSFDWFTLIMLYFYYSVGTTLEHTWGAYRYNVYLFSGMGLTILASFLAYGISSYIYGDALAAYGQATVSTYYALASSLFSTYYINMSIMLAFAATFPSAQVLLMFIIPVRMKWLGIIYAVMLTFQMITGVGDPIGNIFYRLAIGASLLTFLLFYLQQKNKRHMTAKQMIRRQEFKREVKQSAKITRHKCAICGRTEEDDPDLEFRFCSKCNGNYEYCQDHLFTHEHVK